MKKITYILPLLLVLLNFSCASSKIEKPKKQEVMPTEDINKMPAAEEAPIIKFKKPEVFKLPNGLTVILVENHKLPRVNASLRIDNPPIKLGNKKGSDILLSALLGSGSKNMNKDEFNKKIDFYGANVNLYDGGFSINSLSKYFPEILKLTADQALNPQFSQEEFNKEQEKLIESLKSSEKSTPAAADRVMTKLAYGEHPYGEVASVQTVENVQLKDVQDYYNKTFNPNNAYLIVVGDINSEDVKKMAEQNFAQWPKAGRLPEAKLPAIKNVPATEVDFVHMPNADQSEIKVVQRSDIRKNNPDYQKVLLMNAILGGDFNSYLNMTLRENHGWTYGARSHFDTDKFGGLFKASTSVRNTVADSAVVVTLDQINKIRNEKVDPKVLYNNKQKYLGHFVLQMEKPATIANQAYDIFINNLPEDYYETFLQKIEAVSVDDIQQVAQKYLHPDKARIIVAGNANTTVPGLKKAGYKVNFFDKYGQPAKPPKMNQKIPDGITTQTVINKYITALGGTEIIKNLKSIKQIYEGNMQNIQLKMTSAAMAPNKSLSQMEAMGMILSKEVFDGKTARQSIQGQNKPVKPEEVEKMKQTPQPIPELNLIKNGHLDRIADFDENEYYVIIDKDGTEYFFNTQTGLKDKAVKHIKMQGREISQPILYKDYKAVDGFKIPGKIIIVNGPQSIELILKNAEINTLKDSDFK